MRKVLPLGVLVSIFLTGCAPSSISPKIATQEYVEPAVGTTSTASMGDPLIKSSTGYKTELLKLGSASGALSDIKEGTYCHMGNNVYMNPTEKDAVSLKDLYGRVGSSVNYVTYDKAKNSISPPNGTTYDSNEISIKYIPQGLCMVSDSFVQTIEYNGKSSNTLKLTYREFSNSMARSAYTTDFTVDLSNGENMVSYKGAKLKINHADNTSINYTIISGFSSNK